jgi:hypothetical protein
MVVDILLFQPWRCMSVGESSLRCGGGPGQRERWLNDVDAIIIRNGDEHVCTAFEIGVVLRFDLC